MYTTWYNFFYCMEQCKGLRYYMQPINVYCGVHNPNGSQNNTFFGPRQVWIRLLYQELSQWLQYMGTEKSLTQIICFRAVSEMWLNSFQPLNSGYLSAMYNTQSILTGFLFMDPLSGIHWHSHVYGDWEIILLNLLSHGTGIGQVGFHPVQSSCFP